MPYSRGLEQPSYRPGYWDGNKDDIDAAVFIVPRIVPPANGIPDELYDPVSHAGIDKAYLDQPPSIAAYGPDWPSQYGGITRDCNYFETLLWSIGLPYIHAIGNYRGGNDAWGVKEWTDDIATGKYDRKSRQAWKNAPKAGAPQNQKDKRYLQDVINPGFLEVRVPADIAPDAKRSNGSPMVAGEPLVKSKFPLDRLQWITWRGPSALLNKADPLYNKDGTEENIYAYFGLKWTANPRNRSEKFWVIITVTRAKYTY